MSESLSIDWLVSDRIGVLNASNPAESTDVQTQLEDAGFVQVVTVRPWDFTMAWRLPDRSLRNFMVRVTDPSALSRRDLWRLNEFCVYELVHGRRVPIWFEDDRVRRDVVASIRRLFAPGLADLGGFFAEAMATQRGRYAQLPEEPPRPTGCHYCHDGLCRGDLVCHTTTVQGAAAIVRSGRILSACAARGVCGDEMARDPRNAAGDPPDYFEYVMWGPGNCTAVDKLVFERVVGYVPSWEEFEADFRPAVRFFFRFADLEAHPRLTFDGIHAKIHEALELDPYLVLVVIPKGLTGSAELIQLARRHLPPKKATSSPFIGLHYKDWAQNAYRQARARTRSPSRTG